MPLRTIEVSAELLLSAMEQGNRLPACFVEKGIPAGARIVGVSARHAPLTSEEGREMARHLGYTPGHGPVEMIVVDVSHDSFEVGQAAPLELLVTREPAPAP